MSGSYRINSLITRNGQCCLEKLPPLTVFLPQDCITLCCIRQTGRRWGYWQRELILMLLLFFFLQRLEVIVTCMSKEENRTKYFSNKKVISNWTIYFYYFSKLWQNLKKERIVISLGLLRVAYFTQSSAGDRWYERMKIPISHCLKYSQGLA